MKKLLALFLAIGVVFGLAACSGDSSGGSAEAKYENIDNETAKEMIDNDEVVIIDVRTQEEYDEGHLPNSTLLPLDEIEDRLSELDKDKAYLLVCNSGNKSGQAGEILGENGFEKVYNLETGIKKWPYEIEEN